MLTQLIVLEALKTINLILEGIPVAERQKNYMEMVVFWNDLFKRLGIQFNLSPSINQPSSSSANEARQSLLTLAEEVEYQARLKRAMELRQMDQRQMDQRQKENRFE